MTFLAIKMYFPNEQKILDFNLTLIIVLKPQKTNEKRPPFIKRRLKDIL